MSFGMMEGDPVRVRMSALFLSYYAYMLVYIVQWSGSFVHYICICYIKLDYYHCTGISEWFT